MSRLPLEKKVLSENDRIAGRLRERFQERQVFCLNFISSPGAGKTSLLERTLESFSPSERVALLTGDIQMDNDARRLARFGFPVKQITTGGTCHLDARMIERALADWPLESLDTLLIENVGNLVCPSSYDLGEAAKVVVLSVAEGEDKPLKYPAIFFKSELMVLSKTDLLPYVSFDIGKAREYALRVHPGMEIVELSCKTGAGLDDWMKWLARHRESAKDVARASRPLWREHPTPERGRGQDARATPPGIGPRMSARVRKAIEVTGIVQGVGFRPYVYRLALQHNLAGFITNTAAGVSIEVEGPAEAVEDFVSQLPVEVPPLARITQWAASDIPARADGEFRILPSQPGENRRVLISPDVAICDDCLRELLDPSDRRFHYPFINCTNCGPRYTIVRDIPYDRARTSMAVFPMCADCQHEYDDPLDRRFHAQPNACWKCGPQVELWDGEGNRIEAAEPIAEAAVRLQAGYVVAVKGLGGFHLAVDATNPAAVSRLREGKRRVEKPFAIMAPSLKGVRSFCELSDASRGLLESPERPIVLLRKKSACLIAELVAPFNPEYGVFLPYTPLHFLLFAAGRFQALVMTSGNISEEPIAIDNSEAVARLHGIADFFLVHNRDVLLRCDDSVVRACQTVAPLCERRVAGHRPTLQFVRRSRGYVPVPVFLNQDLPPILAVGGELENTVCLTKGRHAFLSQHIGDLENLESYCFFETTISSFKRILEVEPQFLAYDLHPDYFSTRWALGQSSIKRIGVQHHHAHITSCMAENHLDGKVIGVALDGTGYGTDGAVWGGEVLLATYADFERIAHLDYVPMPGGAAAITEPWRMAVSYLQKHFGEAFLDLEIPFARELERRQVAVLVRMAERGVNSPLTSSCGRLFDAVSALAGIRKRVNYEAQAAIELEAAIAGEGEDAVYPFELRPEGSGWIIDTRPLFVALVNDLKCDVPAGIVSRRFHEGFVDVLARVVKLIHAKTNLQNICLSGGSFQNVFLLEHLKRKLEAEGLDVFTHSEVPCGDGGLSLGQALVAANRSP